MTDAINPPEAKRSNMSRYVMYGLLGLAAIWVFYQYMSPRPQPIQVAFLTYPADYDVDPTTARDYFWDNINYWEVVKRQWIGAAVIYRIKNRYVFSVQLQNPAKSDLEVEAWSGPRPRIDGLSAAGQRQRLTNELTGSLWPQKSPMPSGQRQLVAKIKIDREKKGAQQDLPQGFKPLPDTRVVLKDPSGRAVGVGDLDHQ
jgi:hypothetical protein